MGRCKHRLKTFGKELWKKAKVSLMDAAVDMAGVLQEAGAEDPLWFTNETKERIAVANLKAVARKHGDNLTTGEAKIINAFVVDELFRFGKPPEELKGGPEEPGGLIVPHPDEA